MNHTQEEMNRVCENIGRALSVIYSRRLGMDVHITCVPVKAKEEKSVTVRSR